MQDYVSINISYIRKQNYLERKDLAQKYGLTTSAIGTYENAKSYPNIKFIQKFCSEFQINIDDFVNKDLSKQKPKSEGFVTEPETPHYIKDKKTIEMYERIVANYEEQLKLKNQLIDEKEKTNSVYTKTIEALEKEVVMLEVIINQNAINTEAPLLKKIEKLYALVKIEKELEEAQKQKETKKQ